MARPVTPIGYRIAVGFAVLLAFLALVGALGIHLINLAAESTQRLHRHPFTVTSAVSEARRRIMVVNEIIIEAIAFPDRHHAAIAVHELPRLGRIIEDNIAVAGAAYLGPRGDFDNLRQSWATLRTIATELVAQIDRGDIERARELYHAGGGEQAFERAVAHASDMMIFAAGRAQEFVADSGERKDDLVLVVAVVLAGALATGAMLATMLTRDLARSLGGLRRTMELLADGELDVMVPATERGDEIGAMARALEVFKQAAIDKRHTEIKFATVFDACPDIIAITERATGLFLDVNAAFERIVGFRKDEAVDRCSSELGTWADAGERLHLMEALEHSPRLLNFESRFRRKNGEVFVALLSVAALRLGERDCLLIVARDISERKQAEELLVHSTQELARSNIELERFAYVAAHDLQEPCRTICSFAQLLERRHAGQLDDPGRELLGYLAGGARRMQNLVLGLLDYSRAGQSTAPFTDVALSPLLAEVQSDLRAAIDGSGARITVAPLPVVRGDAAQLHQLFTNLIGNAIKFREPGKVPEITLSAAPHPDGWLITVGDNGIGIPAEHVEEVFAIFRRLHGPATYPGAGIGLAVSRRIVERHGGRIWATSEPGGGAAIHFTLPEA